MHSYKTLMHVKFKYITQMSSVFLGQRCRKKDGRGMKISKGIREWAGFTDCRPRDSLVVIVIEICFLKLSIQRKPWEQQKLVQALDPLISFLLACV